MLLKEKKLHKFEWSVYILGTCSGCTNDIISGVRNVGNQPCPKLGTRRVEIGKSQINALYFNVRVNCPDICYHSHVDFSYSIVLSSAEIHQEEDVEEKYEKPLVSVHLLFPSYTKSIWSFCFFLYFSWNVLKYENWYIYMDYSLVRTEIYIIPYSTQTLIFLIQK